LDTELVFSYPPFALLCWKCSLRGILALELSYHLQGGTAVWRGLILVPAPPSPLFHPHTPSLSLSPYGPLLMRRSLCYFLDPLLRFFFAAKGVDSHPFTFFSCSLIED
jgi:hypothetical protein